MPFVLYSVLLNEKIPYICEHECIMSSPFILLNEELDRVFRLPCHVRKSYIAASTRGESVRFWERWRAFLRTNPTFEEPPLTNEESLLLKLSYEKLTVSSGFICLVIDDTKLSREDHDLLESSLNNESLIITFSAAIFSHLTRNKCFQNEFLNGLQLTTGTWRLNSSRSQNNEVLLSEFE